MYILYITASTGLVFVVITGCNDRAVYECEGSSIS